MSRKLLAASLAGGAAIIVVAFQFESKPIYGYRVGDFLARDLRDREVKVEGLLVRGSLCKVEKDCGYRFSLTDYRRRWRAPVSDAHAALRRAEAENVTR